MKTQVQIGWEYLANKDSLAEFYASKGLKLATQLGDSIIMIRAGRVMGSALQRQNKAHQAIEVLTALVPVARRQNSKDELKKMLNVLALAHTFRAEYDKALEYNFQSLVMREAEGNKTQISITLNNIGLVYFKLHNYNDALKYFHQCLVLLEELNDTNRIPTIHVNLGLSYLHLYKFKEAKFQASLALELCGSYCSDEDIIMSWFGLGESSYWLHELDTAKKYLSKSLELARRTNNPRWKAENLVYLGQTSIALKDHSTAIKEFNEAEQIATAFGYSQILIDVYKQFSDFYRESKNYERASYYQGKYITKSDSLIGRELAKSIGKIESNYDQKENIATIASKEVVIRQQTDLNIAIFALAMLAGLFVLVLQLGNRNIKRVNAKLSEAKEIIQRQNGELEYKNRELDIEVDKKTIDLARVNQSLKQVNDELDNFIYKTSHDIRGPLASLKGMCNVALMDVTDPIALDYLRKLDATAERLNSILTRLVIINQINNSKLSLDRIDFKGIVNDVLLLEKKKGLPPDLRITTFIDPKAEIESDKELVRIVLENLIDNAIKFYNDSERVDSFMNIHITSMENGGAKARVIDNGIGISEASPGKLFQMFSRASERSDTGGIGLYITKTATEKIGGRVGLLTTPEGFTEFYVVFPPTPYPTEALRERRVG
ncbi:MAG: tetratricopeptide repeat-containing sensor histidine kinase [Chryseolinea sp.]